MRKLLSYALITALAVGAASPVWSKPVHAEALGSVVINEVESDDPNGGNDWLELYNAGEEAVDLNGYFVTDDKGLERLTEGATTPLPEGTVLEPGAVLVLEDSIDFDFGLGKEDTVTLYTSEQAVADTYSYSGHAGGTYSRVPDGVGEFVDQAATKGALNVVTSEPEPDPEPDTPAPSASGLVINEINSQPDDWVELMNTSNETIDLSGVEIRDNSDDHRWQFNSGVTLEPGMLMVVDAASGGQIYDDQTQSYTEGTFGDAIGIGSGDSIRLYNVQGELLDSYSWTEHAAVDGDGALASYGRYPDGTGSFVLTKETEGMPNEWYAPEVVINEVESNGDATDWAEIKNVGTTPVDISGWYLYDNDPVGHVNDITPVAEGTILEPGAYYVFDQNQDFTFGLGSEDQVSLFNRDGVLVAEFAWTEHAQGVYARIPDGDGELVDYATATKGAPNLELSVVVLNEVQSNDPAGGPDWVELANPTQNTLDISGLVIKDDDDAHVYVVPEGTTIEAGGFLVIDDLGFGLGQGDTVRLFDGEIMIASTTWEGHTNPTWGLYPDVNGSEYRNTLEATPGAPNAFAGIPDVITWPGAAETTVFDTASTFLTDSSGLDFFNGQLYAVDNGTGVFWVLDVASDGTLSFAEGYSAGEAGGKGVRFQKDAADPSAAGPDAEGITVDASGMVYIAAERDNSDKGTNYNTILMVDPSAPGPDVVAQAEWDLTASLPQVSANMGIEAVEWVSNAAVEGVLFDQNTGAPFQAANYPEAVAGGVFFVALEDNGHVYAYVLGADGSATQIADIDPMLGGAMALDFDTYENVLWVVADNGYANMSAKIALNGTQTPDVVQMTAPAGVDTAANNEGFAIADATYTVNGQRPVYRFQDGVSSGALTIGSVTCSYSASTGGEESSQPSDESSQPSGDESSRPGEDSSQPSGEESSQISGDSSQPSGEESSQPSCDSSGNGSDSNSQPQGTQGPQTGDNNAILLWSSVALLSLLVAVIAIALKRALGVRS